MSTGIISQNLEALTIDFEANVHHTSNSINSKTQRASITINALGFSQLSSDTALKKCDNL